MVFVVDQVHNGVCSRSNLQIHFYQYWNIVIYFSKVNNANYLDSEIILHRDIIILITACIGRTYDGTLRQLSERIHYLIVIVLTLYEIYQIINLISTKQTDISSWDTNTAASIFILLGLHCDVWDCFNCSYTIRYDHTALMSWEELINAMIF